jgi:cellobiose phosphorylase
VRENGGQYTHASLWTIWAFADLGNNDLADKLFRLINPIYRADTPENVQHYKVEPYVISADVYGVAPHTGRGGWTWYTGSSGWMYRLGIEAMLGVRRVGNALELHPHIPQGWPGYVITYRYGRTTYRIQVQNTHHTGSGVQQLTLDGEGLPSAQLPLVDDGNQHEVLVQLAR